MKADCQNGMIPATSHRYGLYKDGWFWAALALGPLSNLALSQLMTGSVAVKLPLEHWRNLVWLILLYPVVEEWLFRGLFQSWLVHTIYGRVSVFGFSVANGFTSILFGGAHLLTQPPQWAALVIAPSLVFGWFRDRYDSVLPGIILHCVYNLGYFSILNY